MKNNFDKLIKKIHKGDIFAIFVHLSPDGDAIGSGIALKNLLEKLDKKAYLCCDDNIPESLLFLNPIIEKEDEKIDSCDTYIYLDLSKACRSGKYQKYINAENKTIIVIDHHIEQDRFGNVVVRDEEKSSTCELIYDLYNELNITIDHHTATCLYSGIATDTGCFIHQNTTAGSHKAAAKLIECGANVNLANLELFTKKPAIFSQISKLAYKNMQVYGDKLTLVVIKKKEFEKLNKPESYLFITALSHYTTDILVLVTEKEKNEIKINTRSRISNVQKLCEKFGGGGHIHASGAEVNDSLKNVVRKILKEVF